MIYIFSEQNEYCINKAVFISFFGKIEEKLLECVMVVQIWFCV